jgi:hypothetical protein
VYFKVTKGFAGQDFRFWALNDEIIVLNHPDSLRAAYLAKRGRGATFHLQIPFAGGLSCIPSGERHVALRKFFAPFTNSMKMQHIQEPTLRRHCEALSAFFRHRVQSGEWFDVQEVVESSMFDLATDLVLGFNPDTLNKGSSMLHHDWKLVNESLGWRVVTAATPYWNYDLLKTKSVRAFDAAFARIKSTMFQYVTKCHRYLIG